MTSWSQTKSDQNFSKILSFCTWKNDGAFIMEKLWEVLAREGEQCEMPKFTLAKGGEIGRFDLKVTVPGVWWLKKTWDKISLSQWKEKTAVDKTQAVKIQVWQQFIKDLL